MAGGQDKPGLRMGGSAGAKPRAPSQRQAPPSPALVAEPPPLVVPTEPVLATQVDPVGDSTAPGRHPRGARDDVTDPVAGPPGELPTRVVPSDLAPEPGLGTEVVPQDMTSPGRELDFRAPQRMIHTEVLDRRKPSQVGDQAGDRVVQMRGGGQQQDAEALARAELLRALKRWRAAAMGLAILSMVLAGIVVGQQSLGPSPAPAPRSLPQQEPVSTDIAATPRAAPPPEGDPQPRAEAPVVAPPIVAPPPMKREKLAQPVKPARRRPTTGRGQVAAQKPNPTATPQKAAPAAAGRASFAAHDKMMAELKASPNDVRLFDRLRKNIEGSAASLPPADRKKIMSLTAAAELSYDVGQLSRALALLKRLSN